MPFTPHVGRTPTSADDAHVGLPPGFAVRLQRSGTQNDSAPNCDLRESVAAHSGRST
jgi:hypothetical protein